MLSSSEATPHICRGSNPEFITNFIFFFPSLNLPCMPEPMSVPLPARSVMYEVRWRDTDTPAVWQTDRRSQEPGKASWQSELTKREPLLSISALKVDKQSLSRRFDSASSGLGSCREKKSSYIGRLRSRSWERQPRIYVCVWLCHSK